MELQKGSINDAQNLLIKKEQNHESLHNEYSMDLI